MARLTDSEKQEIIRYLEADKPLPDKYRFLLFDEKREVELVWNGKTNEVCNVVLPFQVIEQVDEPRAESAVTKKGGDELLEWAGISLDGRGRQLKGWTNKLIWGDNKLILSSLKNGPLREEIEKRGADVVGARGHGPDMTGHGRARRLVAWLACPVTFGGVHGVPTGDLRLPGRREGAGCTA